MSIKLYEFAAIVKCAVVIAANSEKQAREEIETYHKEWVEIGEFIISDIDLVDTRKPESTDLRDEAHVICRD